MVFYRFRPTDALLDKFQELERQEIYFAPPKELNDPLEGFKDLVWSGDRILWENLLRHYLLCLTHAVMAALINGPDHTFAEMEELSFSRMSHRRRHPNTERRHRRICEDFFKHEDAAASAQLLAARGSPIRRDELTTYLRLLHLDALNVVLNRAEEEEFIPARPMDDPVRSASLKPIPVGAIIEALKGHEREHPDKPDIAEVISSSYEVRAIQQELISEYNGVSLKLGVAWKALISEFPRRHVRALEQLLYRDWYTACFVTDPTDASLWGTYGNKHQGVCLKLKPPRAQW